MKRIATTAAETSAKNLVARRTVKKQQMRWSERLANLLLQGCVAIANGDLADRLACQPPIQPDRPSLRLSWRSRSFSLPHDLR
jgi:hypothetical protein